MGYTLISIVAEILPLSLSLSGNIGLFFCKFFYDNQEYYLRKMVEAWFKDISLPEIQII